MALQGERESFHDNIQNTKDSDKIFVRKLEDRICRSFIPVPETIKASTPKLTLTQL